MKTWTLSPGGYTAVGNTNDNCNGVGEAALTTGAPSLTEAGCKAHCDTLKAWRLVGAVGTLPTGLVEDGANGAGLPTHCYGVAWGTASCIIYPTTVVTTDGTNDPALNRACFIRDATTAAPTIITENPLVSGATWTALTASIGVWGTA